MHPLCKSDFTKLAITKKLKNNSPNPSTIALACSNKLHPCSDLQKMGDLVTLDERNSFVLIIFNMITP